LSGTDCQTSPTSESILADIQIVAIFDFPMTRKDTMSTSDSATVPSTVNNCENVPNNTLPTVSTTTNNFENAQNSLNSTRPIVSTTCNDSESVQDNSKPTPPTHSVTTTDSGTVQSPLEPISPTGSTTSNDSKNVQDSPEPISPAAPATSNDLENDQDSPNPPSPAGPTTPHGVENVQNSPADPAISNDVDNDETSPADLTTSKNVENVQESPNSPSPADPATFHDVEDDQKPSNPNPPRVPEADGSTNASRIKKLSIPYDEVGENLEYNFRRKFSPKIQASTSKWLRKSKHKDMEGFMRSRGFKIPQGLQAAKRRLNEIRQDKSRDRQGDEYTADQQWKRHQQDWSWGKSSTPRESYKIAKSMGRFARKTRETQSYRAR
jgi:hypothetical protein